MPDRVQGASALRWSAHLLTVGGQPVILSAMTVVPTTLLAKDSGRPPVIVSVVKLDGAMLAAMGRSASISDLRLIDRSEEHTSELQSLMRISYAVFCLKKQKSIKHNNIRPTQQ